MSENSKPDAIKLRMYKDRVKEQIRIMKNVIYRLKSYDVPKNIEAKTIEEFIEFLYPIKGKCLEEETMDSLLADTDLVAYLNPIYINSQNRYHKVIAQNKILAEQRRIMEELKKKVYCERKAATKFDPDAPSTLGWRGWNFNTTTCLLESSSFHTTWHDLELRINNWDESEVVHGTRGIHAHRVPINWKIALNQGYGNVTGIVERYGRYVLGEQGWRAEWVVIRKLLAPTQEIGFALEKAYPDAQVEYFDTERYGDQSWR
jgi:hypothetical protein